MHPGSYFLPFSRAREGQGEARHWERRRFRFVQRSTHQVCQLCDPSCWRPGRTWASSSSAFARLAELQKQKKLNIHIRLANTASKKQGGKKAKGGEGEGIGNDMASSPDPCGGSQTFDMSLSFSSSCIMVRFDRYCFTLRDIMDCVTNIMHSMRHLLILIYCFRIISGIHLFELGGMKIFVVPTSSYIFLGF